jgi:VWFA-related protein
MSRYLIPILSLAVSLSAGAADFVDSHGSRVMEHTRPAAPVNASIRVDVDMTLVPVTVVDEIGRNVRGLDKQNFRIFDGSEPRPIAAFGQQDAPVSVGLVFDCSRSMSDKFKTAREAASNLFHQLNPEDEAFLVTVAGRASLRHDFTSDFAEIENALVFIPSRGLHFSAGWRLSSAFSNEEGSQWPQSPGDCLRWWGQ